ncbi:MAG: hypothetical protein OSB69_18010, partial [Alphaproteobacteria bacterium]|nr:hypothetical protein [Alphaproteobacteria bacterium]
SEFRHPRSGNHQQIKIWKTNQFITEFNLNCKYDTANSDFETTQRPCREVWCCHENVQKKCFPKTKEPRSGFQLKNRPINPAKTLDRIIAKLVFNRLEAEGYRVC